MNSVADTALELAKNPPWVSPQPLRRPNALAKFKTTFSLPGSKNTFLKRDELRPIRFGIPKSVEF
jgi:hypothetical protein